MPAERLSANQLAMLAEMGVTAWIARDQETEAEPAVIDASELPPSRPQSAAAAPTVTAQGRSREAPAPLAPPSAAAPVPARAAIDIPSADWDPLNAAITSCTRCSLHESRTNAVCGVGNRQADWLIIGEAPGEDEDAKGEPFVGRAGQLLNEMLRAIGLQRKQVFIANVLKCRPPKNRDPSPEEVQQCLPYLHRQIALLNPKLILVVGRIAAQNLLKVDTPVGKLRGSVRQLEVAGRQVPVVVTYHPAYLLRSPSNKAKSWADLLLALDVANKS